MVFLQPIQEIAYNLQYHYHASILQFNGNNMVSNIEIVGAGQRFTHRHLERTLNKKKFRRIGISNRRLNNAHAPVVRKCFYFNNELLCPEAGVQTNLKICTKIRRGSKSGRTSQCRALIQMDDSELPVSHRLSFETNKNVLYLFATR
jgi:hypothetical protein